MSDSTKPYLIRAIFEWCVDQGHTPYLSARVNAQTRVPAGYARDGQIVLNISPDACHNLQMGNEIITFQARFGGVAHNLLVPIKNVLAIYARENSQGMAFEIDESQLSEALLDDDNDLGILDSAVDTGPIESPVTKQERSKSSHLKIIK